MTKPAIIGDNFVYVVGKSMDDIPESAPDRSIFQDDSTGFQYWFLDGEWKQANRRGLSTDVKPTDVPINSWFHEDDTDTDFQFNGDEWIAQPKAEPIPEEPPIEPPIEG